MAYYTNKSTGQMVQAHEQRNPMSGQIDYSLPFGTDTGGTPAWQNWSLSQGTPNNPLKSVPMANPTGRFGVTPTLAPYQTSTGDYFIPSDSAGRTGILTGQSGSGGSDSPVSTFLDPAYVKQYGTPYSGNFASTSGPTGGDTNASKTSYTPLSGYTFKTNPFTPGGGVAPGVTNTTQQIGQKPASFDIKGDVLPALATLAVPLAAGVAGGAFAGGAAGSGSAAGGTYTGLGMAGSDAGAAGLPASYGAMTADAAGTAGAISDAPMAAAGTLPAESSGYTGLGMAGNAGNTIADGTFASTAGNGVAGSSLAQNMITGGTGAATGGGSASLGSFLSSLLPTTNAGYAQLGLGLGSLGLRAYQANQLKDIANQSSQKANALDQPQRAPYQSLLEQYYSGGQDITKQPTVAAELAYASRQAQAQLAKQGLTGSGNAPITATNYAVEALNRSAAPYLSQLSSNAGFNQGPGNAGSLYGQYAAGATGDYILGLEDLARMLSQRSSGSQSNFNWGAA